MSEHKRKAGVSKGDRQLIRRARQACGCRRDPRRGILLNACLLLDKSALTRHSHPTQEQLLRTVRAWTAVGSHVMGCQGPVHQMAERTYKQSH